MESGAKIGPHNSSARSACLRPLAGGGESIHAIFRKEELLLEK